METLSAVAIAVIRASAHAALLVPVVLLLQWLLGRRLTAHWRHVLWAAVFFRLLLPQVPTSSLGVIRVPDTQPPPSSVSIEATDLFAADSRSQTANENPTEVAVAPLASLAPGSSHSSVSRTSEVASSFSGRDLFAWGIGIWLLGALLLFCRLAIQALRFQAIINREGVPASDEIKREVADAAEQIQVHCPRLRVLETSAVASPALAGFLTPLLLLPQGEAERRSVCERRCIFLHELAHLKRHDLGVQWFVSVLLCLHWFNPVLWFAAHRLRIDRELATDELALNHANLEERSTYGETIIQLLDEMSSRRQLHTTAVGIAESRLAIRSRIRAIAHYVPGRRGSVFALVISAAILTVGLLEGESDLPANNGVQTSTESEEAVDTEVSEPEEDADPEIETSEITEEVTALPCIVEVVDAVTREPIVGAIVSVENGLINNPTPPGHAPSDSGSFRTDERGRARFEFYPATNMLRGIHIEAASYVPFEFALTPQGDGKPRLVTLQLQKARAIRGRVLDPLGHPLPDTQVWIQYTSPASGGRSIGKPQLVTDSQGFWSFPRLPASAKSVSLMFLHDRFAFDGKPAKPLSEPKHHLSVSTDQWPQPLLETTLVPGTRIYGKVVDESGNGVFPATVRAMGAHHPSTATDPNGLFALPGSYANGVVLVVQAEHFAPRLLELDTSAGLGEQTIVLEPGNSIAIRFSAPDGSLVTNVHPIRLRWKKGDDLMLNRSLFNADGIWEWHGAPKEPVTFSFYSHAGYQTLTGLSLQPQPTPHEIRLTPITRFTISAADAAGRTIHDFEISYRQGARSSDQSPEIEWGIRKSLGTNSLGFEFSPPNSPNQISNTVHEFTISAPGFQEYRTTRSGELGVNLRVDAVLEPSDTASGVLRTRGTGPLPN